MILYKEKKKNVLKNKITCNINVERQVKRREKKLFIVLKEFKLVIKKKLQEIENLNKYV